MTSSIAGRWDFRDSPSALGILREEIPDVLQRVFIADDVFVIIVLSDRRVGISRRALIRLAVTDLNCRIVAPMESASGLRRGM